jgi:hypothetical protein
VRQRSGLTDPLLPRRSTRTRAEAPALEHGLAAAAGLAAALGLVLVLLVALPAAARAQGGLVGACAAAGGDEPECLLAVASMRAVQERVGIALWGGNPVPGTASTLGMRIGSSPRFTAAGKVSLVPVEVPPLLDRATDRSERGWIPGLSAQASMGVVQGWSPLPTMGGVLSMDLLASLAAAPLPRGRGFQNSAVGWSAGARVGLLRESFTLPGVSITTRYGRSNAVGLGDPASDAHDGFARGSVSDLGATLAVSQRISPVRLTAGAALDRYTSSARIGYQATDDLGVGLTRRAEVKGRLTTDRRSFFANASWTTLIFHGIAEAGWQQIPRPDGLPAGVRLDPAGWWAAVAFRISL